MTTVSILMPAFNYARFLREAVDSVLAQSDPDWELVVIDDASTDETWDILQSYADPRIRSSRAERNRGLAATVNEALRRSTGDVIGVLNSDDRYRPDYLARLRGAFAEHPGIDVYGTYISVIDSEGVPRDNQDVGSANQRLDLNDPANWVWQNHLCGASLARRRVFEQIGDFDEDLATTLDWDFWVRALAAGHRFAVLPEELFEWRVHGDNMTNADPAETVRAWSVISARTFHPYLDAIGRPDLKAQNIAGFLTHEVLTQQPLEYTTGILSTILSGDPEELAAAVTHVADESTRLRKAYVDLRAATAEAALTTQQLTDELSATRVERDTLGDRLHAAEADRRATTAQLDKLRSTTIYKAARRMRNTLTRRSH